MSGASDARDANDPLFSMLQIHTTDQLQREIAKQYRTELEKNWLVRWGIQEYVPNQYTKRCMQELRRRSLALGHYPDAHDDTTLRAHQNALEHVSRETETLLEEVEENFPAVAFSRSRRSTLTWCGSLRCQLVVATIIFSCAYLGLQKSVLQTYQDATLKHV